MLVVSDLSADVILMLFAAPVVMAGFDYFRQQGATLAESAAYSILMMVMVTAWIAQVLLMGGWTGGYLAVLLLCAALAWIRLFFCRRRLLPHMASVYRFIGGHRLAATGLAMVWGYATVADILGISGFKGPAAAFWMHVADHPGSLLITADQSIPVLNHLVFTAPWQPDLAAPLALLGAYMAIGFGTYALARRYAWPPMAVTVSVLVTAMPRLVFQAVAGDGELLAAAAALVAILAIYRLVEQPLNIDLVMLLCAITFTIEGGKLCYLIASVLAPLGGILFARRHGMDWLRQKSPLSAVHLVFALAVVAVFSQLGVVGANIYWGRPWVGALPHHEVVFNPDPLMGTVGNMLRYLISSVDLPQWADSVCQYVFGLRFSALMDLVYRLSVGAFTGTDGVRPDFHWTPGNVGSLSWFGPAGFLLVLPSVAVSLWRGPRRLKATALAMLAYWLLVALMVAWQPENVRFMTVFFVCSGFFMAFLLPPWRLGRNGCQLLQVLGVLQIVHVLLSGPG